MVDVARDICKLFNRDPDATIKHVRDRAFNDRRYFMCVMRSGAVCSSGMRVCMRVCGWPQARMHLQLSLFLPLPCPPSCSCDKKLLKLGWQEKTSWEEGLRKTVDWYLQNAKRDYWCAPAALRSLLVLSYCFTASARLWAEGVQHMSELVGRLPQHCARQPSKCCSIPPLSLPCLPQEPRRHGARASAAPYAAAAGVWLRQPCGAPRVM